MSKEHEFCAFIAIEMTLLRALSPIKGIVHLEINCWYVLAYLFVSTAFSILTFFGQTVVVCQSYTGG